MPASHGGHSACGMARAAAAIPMPSRRTDPPMRRGWSEPVGVLAQKPEMKPRVLWWHMSVTPVEQLASAARSLILLNHVRWDPPAFAD